MKFTAGVAWRAYEVRFLGIDQPLSGDVPEDRPWYIRHEDRMLGDADLPPLIEEIRVKQIPGLSLAGCRRLTDAGLAAAIAALPHLAHLDLFNTHASDAAVRQLAGLTGLRTLNLGGTGVSDNCIELLARLPGICNLHLGWTAISSAGLRRLPALPSLEALVLRNTRVDDAGLSHVAQARRLTALSLESTAIGDAGVTNLVPAAPRLRFLDLSYTNVTEASVEALTRFVELRTLGLRAVAVDRGADARLRQALVHLSVHLSVDLPGVGTRDGASPEGLFH